MKPVLLLLLVGISVSAQNVRFYLGTGFNFGTRATNLDTPGVYTGTIDVRNGTLGELHQVATIFHQPFLALTPDGEYLYAVAGGKSSDVVAYRVETNGALTRLNDLPSGNGSCHVTVDATGRNVFVANYAGGDVSYFQTRTNGFLASPISFLNFKGSGPNLQRQDHPYLHSTYVDSENRHLYACDLGTDHIWIFDLDAPDGKLSPASPPSAQVTPGSGPRHLAFSQDQNFAYVNGEMGLNVSVFSRDAKSGALTLLETRLLFPKTNLPLEGMTSAEIFCHPSGKWLYVSIRDVAGKSRDSLIVFAIGKDGRLTWLQNVPARVKVPRSFAIDPEGRWLIACGQRDNQIALFKIEPATGKLSFTGQTAVVGSPTCVIFAPDQKAVVR